MQLVNGSKFAGYKLRNYLRKEDMRAILDTIKIRNPTPFCLYHVNNSCRCQSDNQYISISSILQHIREILGKDFHLGLAIGSKLILVCIPQLLNFLNITFMQLIDVLLTWLRSMGLVNSDRPSDNNVNGSTVRHETNIVIEHTTAVESWHGKLENLEKYHLDSVYKGVCLRAQLVVEIVFAKSDNRN